MTVNEMIRKLSKILSPAKAKETANNKKLAANLIAVMDSAQDGKNDLLKIGPLLYYLASTAPKLQNSADALPYIAKAISSGRLANNDQISAAIKFCTSQSSINVIQEEEFNDACGVGITVSPEEISASISGLLALRDKELMEKRYSMLGSLLNDMRSSLKWANSAMVKEELDKQILALLGPKDDRDDPKKKKEKEKMVAASLKKQNSPTDQNTITPAPALSMAERALSLKFASEGVLSRLHKAGENPQINPQLITDHLVRTGGRVITRFPPEPNGYLHIGHAKAINVNFAYAQAFGGKTNLRYDDTNPQAEEERYFTSILDSVRWLGCEPSQITYSSDHFQRLFDLAVDLILRDKAYVCHCTAQEMFEHRGGESKGARTACAHRDRPISESTAEFQNMKDGKYKEGKATLRMKMDFNNPNPQFWDLVAYRVMFTAHHRTASEWCIYPTYDYTHCLCDSFEDITHSLCTTEFVLSRESYYWLVDALEIYKPVQWEYGRLKLTNTVLSKRKLNQLVTDGHVAGWDDPRLHTLDALRRRGFTPEAINAFVRELGVTTTNSTIEMSRLENYVRDHLNDVAPRLFCVVDPIKVTITNLPHGYIEEVTVPNKPRDDSMGTRVLPFGRVIFIDASDFREVPDADFYRLSVGKNVGLLNVDHPITCTGLIKDSTGKILEILATYDNTDTTDHVNPTKSIKPKTYIQWVGASSRHQSPVPVEIRLYSNLFHHSDPDNKVQVPLGWISDINPNSLEIKNGYCDVGIRGVKTEDKFQFVRVGYFCVDKDSQKDKIVLNRTVALKEDVKKS